MAKQLTEQQLRLIDQMVNEAWYDQVSKWAKNKIDNASDQIKLATGDANARERLDSRQAQASRDMAKNSNSQWAQLKYLWDKRYNQGRGNERRNQRLNAQMETDMNNQNVDSETRQMWEQKCFDYWCQTCDSNFVQNNATYEYNPKTKTFSDVERTTNEKGERIKSPGEIAAIEWTYYMRRVSQNPFWQNQYLAEYIMLCIDQNPYGLKQLSYAKYANWVRATYGDETEY